MFYILINLNIELYCTVYIVNKLILALQPFFRRHLVKLLEGLMVKSRNISF